LRVQKKQKTDKAQNGARP